ncbi:MAG TPA: biliverdin-producing heme oxygenase [Actinomycetota bacterium]|nr:biliverdin-producing heme oxygenase [Actinomycetota bacterium]
MSMVIDRIEELKAKIPTEVVNELADGPLSRVMRRQTWPDHARAEYSDFEQALVKGTLSKEGYLDLLVQVLPVYEALEARAEELRDDPVAGPIVIDELNRTTAIRADIDFYKQVTGTTELPEILEVTQEYVDRVRNSTPEQFVAHHYTRYLADLSGGVFIDRALTQAYGLEGTNGRAYYVFDEIEDANLFKDAYRGTLDQLPLDRDGKRRIMEEVLLAYEFNIEMVEQLGVKHLEPAATA